MKKELFLILFIGIPSLAGLWGFSFWPFSSFAMYSRLHSPIINYKLMAHENDGTSWYLSREHDMRPVGSIWLSSRIQSLLQEQDSKEKIQRIINYYCKKFNKRRTEKHSSVIRISIQDSNQQNLRTYDCE